MDEIILSVLFTSIGLFSFFAAIADWEWFFTSHNASFIVRRIGRKKARLFYGTLGFVLIIAAYLLFDASRPI